MHRINVSNKNIRTDLIIEQTNKQNVLLTKQKNNNLKVIKTLKNDSVYTTITFQDVTDKDNFKIVQDTFIKELKKYLKPTTKDKFLVIGLGNNKSTPDSLGPNTIKQILVTSYLFALGEVEEGYSDVSCFIPDVMGNTGIETSEVIKSIIKISQATKVIIIDALKTNQMNRLVKTIQITNNGISPGSGIGNTRKEISKSTMGKEIIAIGVPTVVDIRNLISYSKDNLSNYIVTPTDIDFIIEKLSILIGNGINISLHKNFIRQNNY